MWIPIDTLQNPLGTKYSPVNMYKETMKEKMKHVENKDANTQSDDKYNIRRTK